VLLKHQSALSGGKLADIPIAFDSFLIVSKTTWSKMAQILNPLGDLWQSIGGPEGG
jgi:hypothetical protein